MASSFFVVYKIKDVFIVSETLTTFHKFHLKDKKTTEKFHEVVQHMAYISSSSWALLHFLATNRNNHKL